MNVNSLSLTKISVNYDAGPEGLLEIPPLHVSVAVGVTRKWCLTHGKVIWNINKFTADTNKSN